MTMNARDVWAPLSSGSHDARVVVRTASGEEVDVRSVRCYAQLCVIETDSPLHTVGPSDGEVITPEQLSELLDAHSAGIDEVTKMLGELQYRGIDTVAMLLDMMDRAECTE